MGKSQKMDEENKGIPLSIKKALIDTDGRLSYSESIGAWNIIRLKNDFVRNLPKLREKKANIYFRIIHYFSYEELLRVIKEMKERGDPLPMLLFLREAGSKIE